MSTGAQFCLTERKKKKKAARGEYQRGKGKPSQLEIYLRSMCNSDSVFELTGYNSALALPLSPPPIEGWYEADIERD